MKKLLSYLSVCALAILAGCAKDTAAVEDRNAQGCLVFGVRFDDKALTRAGAADDILIRIANSEGVLYVYESLEDIPDRLWLLTGNYTVIAERGIKAVYGWDTPYYKGSENFTIKAGETSQVSVDCPIRNTMFEVVFDEQTVRDVMTGYSVTLFPVPGDPSYTIVFDGDNPGAVAYVMLETGETTMDWTFDAIHPVLGQVSKSGKLTGLEAGKKYELTFTYSTSGRNGGFAPELRLNIAGNID